MPETHVNTTFNSYFWLLEHFRGAPVTQIRSAPEDYRNKPGRFVRVNFSELQRLHLRKLQYQLAQHAVRIAFDDEESIQEPGDWEKDLKTYSKSAPGRYMTIPCYLSDATGFLARHYDDVFEGLKDYDYMIDRSKDDADPCILTAERKFDRPIINNALSEKNLPDRFLTLCDQMGSEDPLLIARSDSIQKKTLRRLKMALVGGAFLVGPMWLMVLHNTLYTGLVSTTVFVAVFGMLMAFNCDDEKDVLSSTAAYAAVLVVFVGLNTNGS